MKIADIANFKSRCSHMRFIPCDLLDDGKLRFRASYKFEKIHLLERAFIYE